MGAFYRKIYDFFIVGYDQKAIYTEFKAFYK
jgi:hypothetical protein